MKRRFLLLALAAGLATGWLNNNGPGSAFLKAAMEQFALPFYALELETRPADALLPMPVKGVAARAVADTWKAPRPGRRTHEGQDIFAPRGTPVLSATEGIVARAGVNRLGGNSVTVLGPGGRLYYYAHLDRYADHLQAGQRVKRGGLLGYVGNTGNARTTPPHLHFGVYTAGGAINPLPLLSPEHRASAGQTRKECSSCS